MRMMSFIHIPLEKGGLCERKCRFLFTNPSKKTAFVKQFSCEGPASHKFFIQLKKKLDLYQMSNYNPLVN